MLEWRLRIGDTYFGCWRNIGECFLRWAYALCSLCDVYADIVRSSYRQGHGVAAVANAPTPKKKYRGWGPKVQLGKRLR